MTEGKRTYAYAYHADGQLARADYGDAVRAGRPAASEEFLWDGLALVRRGDERFVNEPHVGNAPKKLCFEGKPRAQRSARRARKGQRGNPVASSKGTTYFNDVLGTTVGVKRGKAYSAAALTAFGEPVPGTGDSALGTKHSASGAASGTFFTGKPHVDGLGYAFLFRNYRASLAKWQTADPLGYPDGWNQLAYGNNSPRTGIDLLGAAWDNVDFVDYYFDQDPSRPNAIDTDLMGLTGAVLPGVRRAATDLIDSVVCQLIREANSDGGRGSRTISRRVSVDCKSIVWAMGGGLGDINGQLTFNWWINRFEYAGHLYERKEYYWQFNGSLKYSDEFSDPSDVLNIIDKDIEIPFGRPYKYGHTWNSQFLYGDGYLWARMIE